MTTRIEDLSNRLNSVNPLGIIKVSTRSAYGQTYVDVIDDKQRGALQSLTGNSTLTQNNINSLKVLGFNFELVQNKPQDINF